MVSQAIGNLNKLPLYVRVNGKDDALGWRPWVGKNTSLPFAGSRVENKSYILTMLNLEAAIEDRDFVPNGRAAISPNLGRSHSWTAGDSNVSVGLF
jgi:hypothetical protein